MGQRENNTSNISSIVACAFLATRMCLQSCCLTTKPQTNNRRTTAECFVCCPIQSYIHRGQARELEDLITKTLPSNGSLHGTFLTVLFQFSGIISCVCLYGTVTAISSGSTILAFRSLGGRIHRHKDSKVIS
jgi:hypothetical protein